MSITEIVKKVRAEQQDEGRCITVSFTGVGIAAQEDQIWAIAPGVQMPPTLRINSKPYDGPIPHDAIRFDEKAAAAYEKANRPRAEPRQPAKLTQPEIMQQLEWNDDAQWARAVASGFPKSRFTRETVDRDGVPAVRIPLWDAEDVQKWQSNIAALQASR